MCRQRQFQCVRAIRNYIEDYAPDLDLETIETPELAKWLEEKNFLPHDTSPIRFAAQIKCYMKGNMI